MSDCSTHAFDTLDTCLLRISFDDADSLETIERKHMLYKSKVEYMAGRGIYTMNHVLGCPHRCEYPCYAYLASKRYGQVADMDEWAAPRLVDNTLELLRREIAAKRKEPIERVHLCFTTDPFPYMTTGITEGRANTISQIHNMTMRSIDLLNSSNIPVTILTKGILPHFASDYDYCRLEDYMAYCPHCWVGFSTLHPQNEYGISLISRNDAFRRRYEPNAAPLLERVTALHALHESGMYTWVSMEPFPTPRIMEEAHCETWDALEVLSLVPFVDRVVFGKWNYGEKHTDDELDWYRRQAQEVRRWCERHRVECIIKKGTE